MKRCLNKGLFLAAMLALASGCQQDGERIALADPTIFVANGKYYMTGTSGDDGFTLLESSNLRHWTYSKADPYILHKGENTYGERDFWAPQIVQLEDRYLMTYSAQGKMCVAESKELTGPYKQRENHPLTDCPEMNIDSYLFKDEDGKWYMYHARYIQQDDMGGNAIFVAEFDMDTQKLKEETLTECLRVSEPWELTLDGMSHNHKTLEGPTVMKRDSIYYMFYSANDYRSVDYAVGYAVAKSPYGPWEKQPGPVIHASEVGENGSGHGDFFIGLDKEPYYVYHVHQNDTTVDPRTVRIMPLKMSKHRVTGIFHISAKKKGNVIVPKLFK